jgi:hypothetical protein
MRKIPIKTFKLVHGILEVKINLSTRFVTLKATIYIFLNTSLFFLIKNKIIVKMTLNLMTIIIQLI